MGDAKMMKEIFDQSVVDETAKFIAAELETLLTRHDSGSRRIREACPVYGRITNGERVVATLKALKGQALSMTGPEEI
jgi:hypothetical protein